MVWASTRISPRRSVKLWLSASVALSCASGRTCVTLPAPKLTLPACAPPSVRAVRKIEPLAWIAVLAETRPFWLMASAANVTLPRSAETMPLLRMKSVRLIEVPPVASISTWKPRSVGSVPSASAR